MTSLAPSTLRSLKFIDSHECHFDYTSISEQCLPLNMCVLVTLAAPLCLCFIYTILCPCSIWFHILHKQVRFLCFVSKVPGVYVCKLFRWVFVITTELGQQKLS